MTTQKIFLGTVFTALVFSALVFPLFSRAAHEPGHVDTPSQTADSPDASVSAAYQFKNEGIFGCNQVAGANASAGTMAAIGGVYVPVNDAAVTLNTGILVYKECVLRPLQDRLRESAMSALLKRQVVGIQTGREGNPRYVVVRDQERRQVAAKTVLAALEDPKITEKLNAAYKDAVRSAVAIAYRSGEEPERSFDCSYKGNSAEALKGNIPSDGTGIPKVLDALSVLTDQGCNPIGQTALLLRITSERTNTAVKDWETAIEEGRGFYPVTDESKDPLATRILNPASVVQGSFQNVFDSPIRQLESANDVGQMIGALFAGVTTQALTDRGGLSGLLQGANGQPSYLEQVTRESSQGVIGAAVNAALQILRASREIENRYFSAMSSIATTLTQTISQIRAAERACWDLIIPKAQEYARNGECSEDEDGVRTCTVPPFQIRPATSTAFSQQVIDSQVRSLAGAAATNIQNSQRALRLIDELVASVTNTASVNAQRIALQQLDNLVAQNALHTRQDAENAEQQRNDVASAMEGLVTDTTQAWGDSPDAAIGWCNVNNSNIPRLWAERWRR